MSEFDKQDQDVFQIVHDNPRRRGVIRDVGYIVNQDVAEQFAAYEASRKRRGPGFQTAACMVLAALLMVAVAVMTLV